MARNALLELMAERLASGLRRSAIVSPSKWAEEYRYMRTGKWSFTYHPWLREMHDSMDDLNIGQKAAQVGFTETVLNLAFYKIDIEGKDCLYVLPSKSPDASDFSAARFDAALELSDHLAKIFSNVKNVGHKRAGAANLYIRGSQSKSGLKSIPVSFMVLDELDEMVEENIPLATKRTSGQLDFTQTWMISTPTIASKGINKYYSKSTQEHFFFKCPSCSRLIEFLFPESLQIVGESYDDPRINESYYKCNECNAKIEHKTKYLQLGSGVWVPTKTVGTEGRGFSVSQLYSSAKAAEPAKIASSYFAAQKDPADEQEFYNSVLGVPHAVEGATVTDEQINNAILNGPKHRRTDPPKFGLNTMGIDVGKTLHWEIANWILPKQSSSSDPTADAKCVVLNHGTATSYEELDELMYKYKVLSCVIDAQPDRRASLQFAAQHFGRVNICYYTVSKSSKTIRTSKDRQEPSITVDRTSWLDMSLGRFRNNSIFLPVDTLRDYKDHIRAPVRYYKRDGEGNPRGVYETGDGVADHFAHARNYCEIALRFLVNDGGGTGVDILE